MKNRASKRVKNLAKVAGTSFHLIGWLTKIFSANAEILFHRNFGRRYLPTLALSLGVYFLFASLATQPNPIRAIFSLILIVRTVLHFMFALTRHNRGIPEPHTRSTGDSCRFWATVEVPVKIVQLWIEPLIL